MPGYSGKSLIEKLGIKDHTKIFIYNNPGEEYEKELGGLPEGVEIADKPDKDTDMIHFFTRSRIELEEKLPVFLKAIKKNGMIWVSWPKKSSGISADVSENIIRDTALPLGLVDVKVCSVTDVWSGLKLFIRKENRVCK